MRILVPILLLSVGAIAGCQTYRPQPIDQQAHLAEWTRRISDLQDVRTFSEQLANQGHRTGSLDVTDGLSLDEAMIVALAYNADLRSARAAAGVALASTEHAGLWDDPVIDVDVLRIIQSVPEPWIAGGVVGFTIPLSGRLDVEKELSASEHAVALQRVQEAEWTVTADLQLEWTQWSALRLEIELLDQLLHRLDEFAQIADYAASLGEISKVEARLFQIEQASREHERLLLNLRREMLELSLKSQMGLRPEVQIAWFPALVIESSITDADLEPRLSDSNPALARLRAEYAAAEHRLHLEVRKQYPDLSIGPAYSNEDGQSRIGISAGMPLPILNANRQGIAETTAARHAARTAFEAEYERLVSQLAQIRAEMTALTLARKQLEHTILPLTEAQVSDDRRLVELGEINSLLTLDIIIRHHEAKVRLINATLAESQAVIRFKALLGLDKNRDSQQIENTP